MIFNPLEVCYAVNWMGLAELKVGWLKGTGVAELAGKDPIQPANVVFSQPHPGHSVTDL